MRRYLIFLIVPVVFILDRWTKLLIMEHLGPGGSIHITSFFSIVYVKNYGGVFGLLSRYEFARTVFTYLPLLIIIALVVVLVVSKMVFAKRFALTCILAGAVGNIYDRVLYGSVVDFLDFHYGAHHWPSFNVADISISFGICLWLFLELFHAKKTARGS
ncbi:MAG TPA: signal peptidase II [Syntrophorhabdaceae bacterium]|nr:signal peptidase II [Syntrophorhabdaceae bacterium]HNT67550.1 signal peptidase II [Syntrophorhabdaceae bacterium]